MYNKIIKELKKYYNPDKADFLPRFFKTGKGEYGEGDKFVGITVPNIRKVAKQFYKQVDLGIIQKLLNNPIHEYRLTGLIMLVYKYEKAEIKTKGEIVKFYEKNFSAVNNWDLVDLTAHKILGDWLLDKGRKKLYKLARSNDLWEKRISMMSTFAFIRENDFKDTLAIARILLHDDHDLIHKVVGWMLREVGKRDMKTEELFLQKYYKQMPRTMLRYAIERFPESKRLQYLHGEI